MIPAATQPASHHLDIVFLLVTAVIISECQMKQIKLFYILWLSILSLFHALGIP